MGKLVEYSREWLHKEKINGAIFDLDGTLLDSANVWSDIDRAFLAKRGFSVPEDYQKTIAPMGFYETACYTIRRFSLDETPEDLIAEWNDMARMAYHQQVLLKPESKDFLDFLHREQIPLAIATASHRDLFEPCLERLGIKDFFSVMLTVQDVGVGKEEPDLYLETARRLGVKPEECLVLEDLPVTIQSASRGGFLTVGVYDQGTTGKEQWHEMKRLSRYLLQE
ncbi:MAG: HAD family phosphatase [Clostridiales bacterium]|nr:HAD family phosphatase [Clostridiales bacterium]